MKENENRELRGDIRQLKNDVKDAEHRAYTLGEKLGMMQPFAQIGKSCMRHHRKEVKHAALRV